MEDLSCKEIYRISKCSEILDEYDKDRSKRYLLLDFCELVTGGSRNRIISYVNCWYRDKEFIFKDVSLNKVLKYKREGDSDKLLILGENLIDKLEEGDESIFQIFNEMMKIQDNNGLRFRRKEAVYLWFEILKDYMWPKQLERVYDFALQMFMRRGMKERPAFGIFLGLICLKRDDLDYSEKDYQKYNPEGFDDYKSKMMKIEIDDYVVNDYHVNKGFGLGKFAEEGAYVRDEELSLLGDKGSQYKEYYIQMKHKSDPKKKKKNPIKATSGVLEEEEKSLKKSIKIKLSFDKFTDVRVFSLNILLAFCHL